MVNSGMTCDPNMIGKFLKDDLLTSESQDFEKHLDSCEACRELLTAKAAGDSWWSEVRSSLHEDEEVTEREISEVLSFLHPSDNPRMLGRFGGYEIAGLIGQGGMGIVLKGFDESLNRYAAIKVLAPQLATRGSARNRFAREAQAAAAVVHENVIAIHGVSESAGLPFLVMPYVRGESLQKRLDRDGPMSPTEIVRIAFQVAAGLSAANKQGLVHRDIKPANILLPEGVQRVLITDFGLARAVDDSNLTRTGTIAGTPQFMSPEQARGDVVDPRSDLFSLGTVIYAMCTGRSPFRASNPYGVLRRIIEDTPRSVREINPGIPTWLEAIVTKLHAKSPDERFQSASELAEILEQCLAHLQNPGGELPNQLQVKPAESLWPVSRIVIGIGLLLAMLGTWNFLGPLFHNDKLPEENVNGVVIEDEQKFTNLPDSSVAMMLAEHEASLPQEEELTPEQRQFREKLFQLNEQLEALREEDNFVDSLAVEKEILLQLKLHDNDHELLTGLREKMIDHRIKGNHVKADQVVLDIQQVELGLLNRYQQLKRIDAMESKVQSQLEPVLRKIRKIEERNRADELDELNELRREEEKITRRLEAEYRGQTSADSAAVNERVDDALDARIAYHQAASELEKAKATLAHSTKLVAKGFITEEQLKSDETAVQIAELKLEKAKNQLRQYDPEGFGGLGGDADTEGPTNPLNNNTNVIESIKQTIVSTELTLDDLKTVYGNDHPKVLKLQGQLDRWRQELEKREAGSSQIDSKNRRQ